MKNTASQADLAVIYRTSHKATEGHTVFPCIWVTVSRVDHMLIHKTSFNKLKVTEIIQSTFLDHSKIK